MTNTATHMRMVSLKKTSSWVYTLRNAVARSYTSSYCHSLRSLHIDFHSNWTHLHSHQPWLRFPFHLTSLPALVICLLHGKYSNRLNLHVTNGYARSTPPVLDFLVYLHFFWKCAFFHYPFIDCIISFLFNYLLCRTFLGPLFPPEGCPDMFIEN